MSVVTTQNDLIMKQVWETEVEILDVVHQVCVQHGLRYSLAYGTLIGAVRHGGFIPWDDDVDLMMPREDYEKLLAVWNQTAPEGYLLQNKRTDPDFTQTFTKIRKDKTIFLQSEGEREKKYHKGIFVDVFPLDRVAPGKYSRMLQYMACAVYLLYSREHTSGTGGAMGAVENILLSVPKGIQRQIRKWAEGFMRQWNRTGKGEYVSACTIHASKHYYPATVFDRTTDILFETKNYSCFAEYDTVLRCEYGDYMQLPPEEERVWKHHPIIIDFEHNYEELKLQK